jgi:hypothetical protein
MTIHTLLSIAATPLIAATGAVVIFLIIDRIAEFRHRKRSRDDHRLAA